MKVTIDSDEPLEDALRVIGTVYDVTLTVAGDVHHVADRAQPSGARRTRRSTGNGRPPSTRTPRVADSAASDSPKVVRQWAVENGYPVNSRGALSAAVREAHRAATTS